MIGKVLFTSAGTPVEAILDDGGAWTCPARSDVAETLNALAAVRPYPGPGSGRFGVEWVHQAADMLGGTAEIPRPEDDEPGRVY